MGKRKPNYGSTVYKGKDGWWHGRVTVGTRDDGWPDRRHVRGKTHAVVLRKVRDLENAREAGRVRKPGRPWTVEKWLTHWVENIAASHVRENTLSGYRVAVNKHLNPGIGRHRLDKLEPEHLERLYQRMIQNGSKPATAHQAHRTARTALGEAVRRGHITENPAQLAKAPRLEEHDLEPFSVDEIRRLLTQAGKSRNSARWALALALGLRQGETLGLKWTDVDLETGILVVRRGRLRPRYEHGCNPTCGRKHAGYCPSRVLTRSETAEVKSRAGRRTIGLPSALVELLSAHRRVQEQERATAGQFWQEGGWVFTTPTGQPLNPSTDHGYWKALLKAAGLRNIRLHDARHTAATVLLILGVPERAVMGIMGWSSSAMARRYQHIVAPVRHDIANRVDALLWGSADENSRELGRAPRGPSKGGG